MDEPNIILVATTLDCRSFLQPIVLLLLYIYLIWMIYTCVIKDVSEYIQRKVSSWVRSQLYGELIPPIGPVISDTIDEYVVENTHAIREYTNTSGNRVVEHTFNGSYVILEIYDIFTKEECAIMRDIAEKGGMEPSQVISGKDEDNKEIDTDMRRSSSIFLSDSFKPVFTKFARTAAKLTGLPIEHQEETQVVSYEAGGVYEAHYDGCAYEDGRKFCIEGYGTAGDRLATLLVYINDGYTGGQTKFTKLGFTVTPEIGKGILFYNIDKNEEIINESEHTGTEVIQGNKWIATKWIHIRAF